MQPRAMAAKMQRWARLKYGTGPRLSSTTTYRASPSFVCTNPFRLPALGCTIRPPPSPNGIRPLSKCLDHLSTLAHPDVPGRKRRQQNAQGACFQQTPSVRSLTNTQPGHSSFPKERKPWPPTARASSSGKQPTPLVQFTPDTPEQATPFCRQARENVPVCTFVHAIPPARQGEFNLYFIPYTGVSLLLFAQNDKRQYTVSPTAHLGVRREKPAWGASSSLAQ